MTPPAKPAKPPKPRKLDTVHLVFGDNEYLVDRRARAIVSEIERETGGDIAVDTLDCEEADLDGVVAELATPSLFSTNRVTVLKHFKLTAESKLAREIERSLAAGLAPGQHLVMAADKVDKRLRLAKMVAEEGHAVEEPALDAGGLRVWIGERFREEGKAASPGVAEILLDLVGDDLRALDSEISKIATYVGAEPKVTGDHLHSLVGRSRTERVFELVHHVLERRPAQALGVVADMLNSGESGIWMVIYLAKEVKWLVQVRLFLAAERGLWDHGMKFNEFTREVLPQFKAWVEARGIPPSDTFLYQKPYASYRRFLEADRCNLKMLLGMLEGLVEANRLLVNTSVSDKVVLERFVSALET
jgi:DNA polymerase-3 subunit delta